MSPRSKCYCFSQSWGTRIQKFFLSANHGDGQYFSVFHSPIHFEIHVAGPVFLKNNNTIKYSFSNCSFTSILSFVNIHSLTCNIHSLIGVNSLFMYLTACNITQRWICNARFFCNFVKFSVELFSELMWIITFSFFKILKKDA